MVCVNMTCFPIFGTYYICLSHHVLTWNYSSCVSCISHLWWDTFKLAVWYWFASWIWFLACIASILMNATYDETVLTWQSDIDCIFHMVSCSVSNLLKCLLLSYHIIGVNMSSRPFFSYIFHPRIMTLPFIRVVFVSIMHEWVLKSEFYSFFLSVWHHNAKSIKRKKIGMHWMMVVLCSNINGASVRILLVLLVHYKVQVSAPLLHHPRCLL